ncbi:MAG: tripartite tricarboxylate transporter substrate binding protein [Burkholderiales bacterium]
MSVMQRTAMPIVIAAVCGVPQVSAQNYPAKPIRIIVPFTAGGSSDIAARVIGQKFTESWGPQAIVENRPGAGAVTGTDLVAKSPPDGYTLLLQTIAFAIIPSLRKLPYDAMKDFAPVTQISALPLVLVVHPSLPAKTVKELVALAKSRPGTLTYASSGNGTSPHLAGEMFKSMAKINLVHIPYKGNAPAMNDLLGGHVMVNVGLLPVLLPYINSGKLRALATTTGKRLTALPNLPTMAEAGFAGYEISSWQGVFAPAATHSDIVAKLHQEIARILNQPDMRQRLENDGTQIIASTPPQFGAFVRAEITKWARVVKESGATAD